MNPCDHDWIMINVRHGYLVVEGCFECGARSSYFSTEAVAPVEEYQEGKHFWIHMGSSQAVKFDLACTACGKTVALDEMMGLMLSTCTDPACAVADLARQGSPSTWVYVALCGDSTHASGRCVGREGIQALNEYFNRKLVNTSKSIVVVPCELCCGIDKCQGIIIADTGLTDFYSGESAAPQRPGGKK